MKHSVFYILLCLCVGALCSCENEPEQVPVPSGPSMQIVNITVAQNQWGYSNQNDNNFFFATVDMPEITEAVFDGGLIKMYRTYNFTSANATQMEMPYVRVNETYANEQWYFFTETVDYDFGIGKMTIYYAASDFDYELNEQFVPEPMTFRCVIVY